MFNYIVHLFFVFYLWSSIVAVPYHKVDYELANSNSSNRYQVQTNYDRKIHSNTTLTQNTKPISISSSTEAETNTSYDEQYNEYNDDVLNKILNVTSDISDDTTDNYVTTTRTEAENNKSHEELFNEYYDDVLKKNFNVTRTTENNTDYEELFNAYYDDVFKMSFNVTSDISAYDDTTENYMTSTSTAVAVRDYNSTWTTITWNYDEVYADALIYLIIFILVLSLIMFLWKIAHL